MDPESVLEDELSRWRGGVPLRGDIESEGVTSASFFRDLVWVVFRLARLGERLSAGVAGLATLRCLLLALGFGTVGMPGTGSILPASKRR